MKLLLTSAGVRNTSIVGAVEELVGKPKEQISFGVINEAYAVEGGDQFWIVEELNRLHEAFGGVIDFVNLLALDSGQVATRLQDYDVIYTLGGHTDYLQSVFDKSGFSQLLPELLKTKVYLGSSAGSMVLGKRIGTEAYRHVYGEEGTYGVERYLELVDFGMKPHLNSPDFPNNREEYLQKATEGLNFPVYAIDDQSAIKVVDNAVEVISEGTWHVYNS